MVRESEVREKLVDALQDELSLEEFAEWLLSVRREMHRNSDPDARALAASISVLLYQHFEGYLRQPRLLEELRALVAAPIVVSVPAMPDAATVQRPVVTVTGSFEVIPDVLLVGV